MDLPWAPAVINNSSVIISSRSCSGNGSDRAGGAGALAGSIHIYESIPKLPHRRGLAAASVSSLQQPSPLHLFAYKGIPSPPRLSLPQPHNCDSNARREIDGGINRNPALPLLFSLLEAGDVAARAEGYLEYFGIYEASG
ncbi:hypothetical protein KM043_014982 [Ampulex compressa]|nr:hypothetical protein KM043_014982 [Ampulex compressa]